MKWVTIMAHVDLDICRGYRVCGKVCPVYVIHITYRKAAVEESDYRGCANCADRCPFHAIIMVKREEPFTVGVDASQFDAAKILALCEKAHFHPQQVLCYRAGVRAGEIVAVILDGADTSEEISSRIGIRIGCTIKCIQPILRLLEAAGVQPRPNPDGRQWYGETITVWTMPEKVKQKYVSRDFYLDKDRKLLDQVAIANQEIQERRQSHVQ